MSKTKEVFDTRLRELIFQRGNATIQIERLKSQLDEIDKQITALDNGAALSSVVETQLLNETENKIKEINKKIESTKACTGKCESKKK